MVESTGTSLPNKVAVCHGIKVIHHQLRFLPSIGIAKAFGFTKQVHSPELDLQCNN